MPQADSIGTVLEMPLADLTSERADGSEARIEAAERELGVVFSRSYRAFLRIFGTASVEGYRIYGLPAHSVRGDVVMMNQLAPQQFAHHMVLIAERRDGLAYYLDTSRMRSTGECPILAVGPEDVEQTVAESFREFLAEVMARLL